MKESVKMILVSAALSDQEDTTTMVDVLQVCLSVLCVCLLLSNFYLVHRWVQEDKAFVAQWGERHADYETIADGFRVAP